MVYGGSSENINKVNIYLRVAYWMRFGVARSTLSTSGKLITVCILECLIYLVTYSSGSRGRSAKALYVTGSNPVVTSNMVGVAQ